jgi:hypothetical protein
LKYISNGSLTLIGVDLEQSEFPMIVDTILLGKHKDQSPEITDEPGVYAIISLVGSHEDLGHEGKESFKRELLKMEQ